MPIFPKMAIFYPLLVRFHLITSLILIRSPHTKLELLNNFLAPMPKQKKVEKNRKNFSDTTCCKVAKNW